jgi:hypothetical protein
MAPNRSNSGAALVADISLYSVPKVTSDRRLRLDIGRQIIDKRSRQLLLP